MISDIKTIQEIKQIVDTDKYEWSIYDKMEFLNLAKQEILKSQYECKEFYFCLFAQQHDYMLFINSYCFKWKFPELFEILKKCQLLNKFNAEKIKPSYRHWTYFVSWDGCDYFSRLDVIQKLKKKLMKELKR